MKDPYCNIPATSWTQRWAKIRSALANLPQAYSLLWEADSTATVVMAVVTCVSAAMPASHAWITKLIIDGVLSAIQRGDTPLEGLGAVAPYILAEFALILVSAVTGQCRSLVSQLINLRLGHLINRRIMKKALSLEVRWFENPEFYDKMHNARRQSSYRAMGLVNGGLLLAQNILTLASVLALLLSFSPGIACLLFAASIPVFIVQNRFSDLRFRLQEWRTPESRQMGYIEQVLTLASTVKEVKLFRLGEKLLKRHDETFWRIYKEDSALAVGRSVKSLLWGLVANAAYYFAYAWIVLATVGGRITMGSMVLYLSLTRDSQSTFQGLLLNLSELYENGLFLSNLADFMALEPQAVLPADETPPDEDPAQGIEFKNVSFRYPGEKNWALEDFSLEIRPKERLALLGENGAGKTTIIKLLMCLYVPTQGRILFHGVDLRHFRPEQLHRRIGAIFQDYVQYQLTLRENIGFGSIENVDDLDKIMAAAAQSGTDETAKSLPKGFEARLGRWFAEGHELSSGQWQKVALARAFMAQGEVIVLDEPASSLDAMAEFEIFNRFHELSSNKIALLVSHRLSTVRKADRIAVISKGRLEELGSHEELLEKGGIYARLFEMQAKSFR